MTKRKWVESKDGRCVAIYARVSTDEQDTATQIDLCRRACKNKAQLTGDREFEEPYEYRDDATSGGVAFAERPEAKRLLRQIKRGAFKHIVVAKLDRLGRNARDTLGVIELCEKHKVSIEFLSPQIDTGTAMGKLFITILAAMAEWELNMIRERTRDSLTFRRKNGRVYGTVPFGWDSVETGNITNRGKPERILVRNEEEQQVISKIKRKRKAGMSIQKIQRWLNEKKILSKNGKAWHNSGVERVLKRKEIVTN